MLLRSVPKIAEDIDYLCTHDATLSSLNVPQDLLRWDVFESGFQGLVRVVQSQQISARVADTLWVKLQSFAEGNVTPQFLLSFDAERLKPYGFTKQKTIYVQSLAQNILNGQFCPNKVSDMSNEDAMQAIIALKGFGLWSAQIYLIFCEQRSNILPANDLIMDRAVQSLFYLDKRPDYDVLQEKCSLWDGRYTAATLLCWAGYSSGAIAPVSK